MTSDVKSRARVRWAKPEDYAAVVGIHEFVYDGGDYLPVMYHVFLQRKEADCFVLEVDGEIVAFKVLHETPDNTGLVSCAMRLGELYQKHGLSSFMGEECLKLSLEKRPWIKMTTYTSSLTPFIKRALDEKNDFGIAKIVGTSYHYYINREQLVVSLTHIQSCLNPDVTCTSCSKTDLQDLILIRKYMEKVSNRSIMPAGENWFPYQMTDQDLKHLMASNQLFFVRRQNSGCDDIAEILGLGYMSSCKCPVGPRHQMYIWCEDIDQFKALLVAMINHCVKVSKPGDCVVFDTNLFRGPTAEIIRFLTPIFGCSYLRATDAFVDAVVIEKSLKYTASKL